MKSFGLKRFKPLWLGYLYLHLQHQLYRWPDGGQLKCCMQGHLLHARKSSSCWYSCRWRRARAGAFLISDVRLSDLHRLLPHAPELSRLNAVLQVLQDQGEQHCREFVHQGSFGSTLGIVAMLILYFGASHSRCGRPVIIRPKHTCELRSARVDYLGGPTRQSSSINNWHRRAVLKSEMGGMGGAIGAGYDVC